LDKTTGGTVTISSDNSSGGYTGATTVSAGTLIIDGNISTSTTTVSGTGILAGSGTVGDLTIAAGGTHNPGNSPGIMNTGDYTMAGTLNIEAIGNTPGIGGYDQVNVTGTINLSGTLATSFTAGTYANGNLLFILLNDGGDAVSGNFATLTQGAIVTNYGGYDWQISYTADSTGNTFTGGNDIALMAIPEPNVAALLGGLGTLLLLRRRRTA
jgi:autotransporter-associated beta strand protein